MKDTIQAKVGYNILIRRHKETREKLYLLMDGDKPIMVAKPASIADMRYNARNNECFVRYEVFTTVAGDQYVYWADTETGEDFLTKVSK